MGLFDKCLLVLALLPSLASAGGLEDSVAWLETHQKPDGSWGGSGCWEPVCTPYAALALLAAKANSSSLPAALAWMKSDLNDVNSYSWSEADIPGAELYAVAESGNFTDLNTTNATARLLEFQDNATGGFRGWLTPDGAIADAVDTAFALRGLAGAGGINETAALAAEAYLDSLQNADGSYNFSANYSEQGLSAYAPDITSNTALVLLALHDRGRTPDEEHARKALEFLKQQARSCYADANRSYTASLSALAFSAFNETRYASAAASYLLLLQQADGGFYDARRYENASNALDTGAATLALAALDGSALNCSPQEPALEPIPDSTTGNLVRITVLNLSANGFANALVTLPNATAIALALAFNASTGAFEAEFNASLAGEYQVQADAGAYYNRFALNASFNATPAPTPTPTATPAPTQAVSNAYYGSQGTSDYRPPASTPTPTASNPPNPTPTLTPTVVFKEVKEPTQAPEPASTPSAPAGTPAPSLSRAPAERTPASTRPEPARVTGLFAAGFNEMAGLAALAIAAGLYAYYHISKKGAA
ncbi:MAG: prenyltransferase/squalene oxidase repeat-containing protein [Candidatus Micrarchaeota archaeon]